MAKLQWQTSHPPTLTVEAFQVSRPGQSSPLCMLMCQVSPCIRCLALHLLVRETTFLRLPSSSAHSHPILPHMATGYGFPPTHGSRSSLFPFQAFTGVRAEWKSHHLYSLGRWRDQVGLVNPSTL